MNDNLYSKIFIDEVLLVHENFSLYIEKYPDITEMDQYSKRKNGIIEAIIVE